MRGLLGRLLVALAAGPVMYTGGTAWAAETDKPLLPGGASSLQESYDDWRVVCVVANPSKQCSLQQQQNDSKTGRRVLMIRLSPSTDGGATGELVMPFGLAIDSGVSLSRDEESNATPARFATCLPAGCIVPLIFDPAALVSYRAGKQLKLTAKAAGGGSAAFSVSLKGFGAAFDRAFALLK